MTCRVEGHAWPIDLPSIFTPAEQRLVDSFIAPFTMTCHLCGTTMTVRNDGSRSYQVSTKPTH